VIELQLSHAERNKVRAAYNPAERLPEQRKMMQAWADYLDGLKKGAKVLAIGGKRAWGSPPRLPRVIGVALRARTSDRILNPPTR
jgi:hypothetical protein